MRISSVAFAATLLLATIKGAGAQREQQYRGSCGGEYCAGYLERGKRHFKAVLTADGGSDLVAPVRRRVVDLVDARAGGFRGGDCRVEAGEELRHGFTRLAP